MKREFPDTIKLSSAYSKAPCGITPKRVLPAVVQAKQSEVQRPSLALALNHTDKTAFQAGARQDSMFLHNRSSLEKIPVTNPLAALESNRHRRVRTSAAMVGLALSVGASNVLSLWNIKSAFAAEESGQSETLQDGVSNTLNLDSMQAIVPPSPVVQDLSFSEVSTLASSAIETPINGSRFELADYYPHELFSHTVEAGETLANIARLYGLETEILASFNHLSVKAILPIGQVLQFPRVLASVPSNPKASVLWAQDTNLKGKPDALKSLGASFDSPSEAVIPLQIQPASSPETLPIALLPTAEVTPDRSTINLADLVPYRVKAGDTLGKIARVYQVAPSMLIAVNQIQNPNLLRVDQLIAVPRREISLGIVPTLSSEESSVPILESVGSKPIETQTSGIELAGNPLITSPETNSSSIVASPIVASPILASVLNQDASRSPYEATNALSGELSYQVQPGDTLAKIARSYGVSLSELIRANQLSNPNIILVNQSVSIPNGSSRQGIAFNNSGTSVQIAVNPTPSSVELGQPTESKVVNDTIAVRSAPQLQVNTAIIPTVPSLQSVVQESIDLPTPTTVSVVTPEVPNLLAAIAPQSTATPFNPGAIVPSAVESQTEPSAELGNPYVSNLLSEVRALRDRYRAGAGVAGEIGTQTVVTPVAVPIAVPQAPVVTQRPQTPPMVSTGERINPEFNPQNDRNSGEAENSKLAPALTPPSTILAAAPLGSSSYEPLVQSLVGQTVSPALPFLTADPYLPKEGHSSSGFIWPAQGVFTSGYGWRWGRMHKGIDIAAPVGTPIVAAASGVVISAGWNSGGYGNLVEIRHDDGSVTLYAHNDRILVRAGQYVQQGDQVSEMGSTGYSTGPHLHFEIHPSGNGAVNPMAYLPK